MSKKFIITIVVAVAALVFIVSYPKFLPQNKGNVEQTQTAPLINQDETANWKTYRNSDYGYEFRYPSNWTYSEDAKNYPEMKEYHVQFSNEKNEKVMFLRNPIFEGGWEPYILVKEEFINIPDSNQRLRWQEWTFDTNDKSESVPNEPSFIYVIWGNGKGSVGSISTNFKDITDEKVIILRKILSTFKFTK